MIIRAHEVTMDGFDLHSDGHLVTLFSATNYCGVCGNNGAVIEAKVIAWQLCGLATVLITMANQDVAGA